MEGVEGPPSSREDSAAFGSSIGSEAPDSASQGAASEGAGLPAPEPVGDSVLGLQTAEDQTDPAEPMGVPPTGALALIEQLRNRQRARGSTAWDIEDTDVDAAQLTNVALPIKCCASDASNESSSAATTGVCPVRRAPSSIDFETVIAVPYHPQYRRVVEEEEDAELERLLRQLDEEQQAVRDLAVAQRYQLMQEQLALIQKQLGKENAKVPDLDWLLANDPETSHELEDVVAAFAARDDDLPQEAPEAPDLPLTCRNFFCRCPWRADMRKDERALATTVGSRPPPSSPSGLVLPCFVPCNLLDHSWLPVVSCCHSAFGGL